MTPEPDFDPTVDLDPNEAIEMGYDPDTDTDEDPANDVGHEYTPEPVEGAKPVDPSFADAEIPSAEDDFEKES